MVVRDGHPPGASGGAVLDARLRVAVVIAAAALLGTCMQRPPVLDQIRELGELRVAARPGPTSYYESANGPEGPEYELAARFARELGVRPVFRLVPSPDAILDAVATGRAHVGAPGLAVAPAWEGRVAFSAPYQTVRLHVVYRRDRPRPAALGDLVGLRLEVAGGSAHAAALTAAAGEVPELSYTERSDADTLDLLDDVSQGRIDATVADAHEFALGRNFHPELRVGFDLPGEQRLAWAVPRDDSAFAARVGAYFEGLRPELAALMDRYYGNTERLDYVGARNFVRHVQERLPPLRRYFEEAAAELGEDWRVLAAIGYQESKWDPAAVSPTGVRGVMMLTSDTAARMGVKDRADPRESIFGGSRYFQMMHRTIPERIPEPDRTWFALAAYNLGYGSLEDGRVLTQMHGEDPDSWQAVRKHLPLLGQERWYVQVKRGYARGWEAVKFVDGVRSYIDILEWMAPAGLPAEQTRGTPAPQAQPATGSALPLAPQRREAKKDFSSAPQSSASTPPKASTE